MLPQRRSWVSSKQGCFIPFVYRSALCTWSGVTEGVAVSLTLFPQVSFGRQWMVVVADPELLRQVCVET